MVNKIEPCDHIESGKLCGVFHLIGSRFVMENGRYTFLGFKCKKCNEWIGSEDVYQIQDSSMLSC
jgi:hypothetical protein